MSIKIHNPDGTTRHFATLEEYHVAKLSLKVSTKLKEERRHGRVREIKVEELDAYMEYLDNEK